MFGKLLTTIRTSAFLRHNAVSLLGAVTVGALNYAYYPILGRMLNVEAYGEVQALVSLFLQLTIFLIVLSQVTVNVVANYQDAAQQRRVVFELEKVALIFSLALFAIVLVFGWKLRSFFQFGSAWPFMVLMMALVASVPLTFRSAFLRGNKRFGTVSMANFIGAAGKIVFSAVLVWIGWSTAGAIMGIVIAQVLAFGYAAYHARQAGFLRPDGVTLHSLPDWKVLRPEVKYGLFVLCGSLTVTVLSSVDIFVVKHFFDAETAGRYAGVSTVARMIFFLTASVAQVLLPSVRIHQTVKQNRHFLYKSFALVAALGGLTTIFFTVFEHQIISVLMGNGYTTYAHLLGPLSLTMFIISVLNLIVSYYIALRRYQISGIVVLGAVTTGCLLSVSHGSLDAIVHSLLLGSTSMLLMLALWRVYLVVQTRNQHVTP